MSASLFEQYRYRIGRLRAADRARKESASTRLERLARELVTDLSEDLDGSLHSPDDAEALAPLLHRRLSLYAVRVRDIADCSEKAWLAPGRFRKLVGHCLRRLIRDSGTLGSTRRYLAAAVVVLTADLADLVEPPRPPRETADRLNRFVPELIEIATRA